jgi:hypothetical protein
MSTRMKGQRFMAGRKVRTVHAALWMVAAAGLSEVASADVSARRLRDAGAERVLEATASRRDRVEVIARVPRPLAGAAASEDEAATPASSPSSEIGPHFAVTWPGSIVRLQRSNRQTGSSHPASD